MRFGDRVVAITDMVKSGTKGQEILVHKGEVGVVAKVHSRDGSVVLAKFADGREVSLAEDVTCRLVESSPEATEIAVELRQWAETAAGDVAMTIVDEPEEHDYLDAVAIVKNCAGDRALAIDCLADQWFSDESGADATWDRWLDKRAEVAKRCDVDPESIKRIDVAGELMKLCQHWDRYLMERALE